MIRRSICIFTILLLCLMTAASVHAQSTVPIKIPNYLNYQGKLEEKDPNRDPIPANGTYTMTFRIYDYPNAPITSCIWEETREVEVVIGIFNVSLGEIKPLDLEFEQDYWLGLDVDPNGEMTPRQRIASTGYSFMAQDSYSLNGFESGEGNGLDADMVDNIDASTMPEANKLLALDGSGEFPNSVLKMGDGRGLDADTVDGVHYTAISSEIDNKISSHTTEWGHLTQTQKTDLTDGGATTLHYHDINSCQPGFYIRQINPDGSVICESVDWENISSIPTGLENGGGPSLTTYSCSCSNFCERTCLIGSHDVCVLSGVDTYEDSNSGGQLARVGQYGASGEWGIYVKEEHDDPITAYATCMDW